jgi:hypothetical protein
MWQCIHQSFSIAFLILLWFSSSAELWTLANKKRAYVDWVKTVDTFATRAKKKGISDDHIMMLTDTLDNNNRRIVDCLFEQATDNANHRQESDWNKEAAALELAQEKIERTLYSPNSGRRRLHGLGTEDQNIVNIEH